MTTTWNPDTDRPNSALVEDRDPQAAEVNDAEVSQWAENWAARQRAALAAQIVAGGEA